MKNKCKGCTERKLKCHATCESYLQYAKEQEQIRKNRQKYLQANSETSRAIQRSYRTIGVRFKRNYIHGMEAEK